MDLKSPIPSPVRSSHASFPIIAVAIIGILATAFLLVSYYIFVIKCCLNWHRIDLLRRLSFSQRRRADDGTVTFTPVPEPRGLDEAAIRAIPIFIFEKHTGRPSPCECAVCLNEFQEEEKLRIIPNCAHVFHIDCIDVWLQNNANCPLCRTSISPEIKFPIPDPIPNHSQDPDPQIQDTYVTIEIGQEEQANQAIRIQERPNSGQAITISSGTTKLRKKLGHRGSMGDEWIDIDRIKDEQFSVQPIRRSFSMDSAGDTQLWLAVQEIMQRHRQGSGVEFITQNECSSSSSNSRCKKSFFSFGQAKGTSRSAVQPVFLEP